MSARHSAAPVASLAAPERREVAPSVLHGFTIQGAFIVLQYRGKYDIADQFLAIPIQSLEATYLQYRMAVLEANGTISGRLPPGQSDPSRTAPSGTPRGS